jgi:hypothetical protein
MLARSVLARDGRVGSKSAELTVRLIEGEEMSPLWVDAVGDPGDWGDADCEESLGVFRPVSEKTLVLRCVVGREKVACDDSKNGEAPLEGDGPMDGGSGWLPVCVADRRNNDRMRVEVVRFALGRLDGDSSGACAFGVL